MAYQSEEDKLGLIEKLEDSYRAIVEKPLDPSSVATISTVWKGLQAIQSSEAETNLVNRFQRRCVMITNYGAWFWLDGWILEQCKKILAGTWASGEVWLQKLVKNVQLIRSLRMTTKEFKPSEFGLNLSTNSYTYKSPAIQWNLSDEEESNKIMSITIQIIQHWLGFPTGKDAKEGRQKAWFVHVILRELGENVLLLNQTWSAYIQTKKNMFASVDASNPSLFDCAIPFQEAARRHPLNDRATEEYLLMRRASEMLTAVKEGKTGSIDEGAQDQVATGSNLPVDRIPAEVQYIAEDKANKFVGYVREMLELDRLGLNGISSPSDLQKLVAQSPDQLMPFRERAPGRTRSRSDDGPFARNKCATREGLFSALIWRGITFSTEFSLQEPMIFENYDAWNSALEDIFDSGAETNYVCDIKAYGVTNPKRGIHHAEAYWNATNVNDWSDFVKDGPVPFMKTYRDFFYTGKQPARFPQFGPLCGYLITADYVYTGLVEMPSLNDIGTVIRTINRGGASGLELLGLIKPRARKGRTKSVPAETECQQGVIRVHDILKRELTDDEWTQGQFNPIVIEHLLCKYSKVAIQRILYKR